MHPQLELIADEYRSAQRRLHDLLRTVPVERWSKRAHPDRWSVAECVDPAQARQFCGRGEDVGATGIGAVAGLREQCRGAGAGQQFDDLGGRVVAVQ